jgi:uncharacterized protein
MTIIDKLFRKSPFKPLIDHAQCVLECVEMVDPVVDAWFAERWVEIDELKIKMSEKEKIADEKKIDIREMLPKSLFFPVPRGDLMRILNNQDDIADTAEDLCVLLSLRKTKLSDDLKDDVRMLTNKCIESCVMILGASEELDLLMEASFSGPEAKKVIESANMVDKLEYEADCIAQNILKKMFLMEEKLNPITIMLCMKIFKTLGMLANHAENCGDNLRHLIICRT